MLFIQINARAKYSISFGGSFPELLLPQEMDNCLPDGNLLEDGTSLASGQTQMNWTLYLPNACHPLLLQQHRQKLQKATQDLNDATAEIRRRKQRGSMSLNQEVDFSISSLKMQFEEIKQSPPVPINVFVSKNIRVAVITGPNTGGKTILLKTVGLAAMMAKSGLYVLSSESVRIPWCDFVFADIGDEQSLSQSLSTFSGHLKQICEILSHSTSRSLVLLDEVGAGTNPLEGAALGMSLLESFAETGPLLTMATTHHGELKTLKYSNNVFENACMEFDEVKLKPTFRILWGVPGRSNAINIAQRLGLPNAILDGARELYGAASAEINEIILDMERFKQNFHNKIQEAEHYLMLSKDLYQQLILANRKVTEYGINQRNEMMNEISKAAAAACSTLHEKLRQQRAFATQGPQHKSKHTLMPANPNGITARKKTSRSIGERESTETSGGIRAATPRETRQPVTEKRVKIPKEGDVVQVPSLNHKAVVLKVEPLKEEILVQAGRMKLKLKLVDVLN